MSAAKVLRARADRAAATAENYVNPGLALHFHNKAAELRALADLVEWFRPLGGRCRLCHCYDGHTERCQYAAVERVIGEQGNE